MNEIMMNGKALKLKPDPSMPPGREGTVYRDPTDPDFVIKLLHTPDNPWRQKLQYMLSIPLVVPDIAWPTEFVYALDGTTIVGCRMPYVARKYPIVAVYSDDPTNRWLGADYAFRIGVAVNLAAAVHKVHQHGCVVGDLSPKNILVGKDGSVCLIDVDSFQISRNGVTYRCNVGTPEYTPPELHGPNFSDVDRIVQHDAFGLGAFIFELLVGPGNHPFAARYLGLSNPLPLSERIRMGIWPYANRGPAEYAPRTSAPFDLLPPVLQPLVRRCFELGHFTPTDRPLPEQWLIALRDVQQDTDFVQIVAPQLEADAQAQHRKARLAALGNPPQPPLAVSRLNLKLLAMLANQCKQAVCTSTAKKLVMVAVVVLGLFFTKWSPWDFLFGSGHYRTTPSLYRELCRPRPREPPASNSPRRPRKTPHLYQQLSEQEQ